MKKTLSLIFSFVLVACSSNTNKQKMVPVLDLDSAIKQSVSTQFVWNDIAKQIQIIPVQTSSSALIGLSPVIVHMDADSYYLVEHQTKTIFRIGKNGEIIGSFSHVGKGPGEYVNCSFVHVNSVDSTIHVFDSGSNKYLKYTLDGKFLKETFLQGKNINVPLFASNTEFLMKGSTEGEHLLYLTDQNLNLQRSLLPIDTTASVMERLVIINQMSRFRNRDMPIINYTNQDTVYTIEEDRLQPLFVLSKGEYRLPDEEAKKMMNPSPEGSPYVRSLLLGVLPDHYIIAYLLKNKQYQEVWRKEDGSILARFSNENQEFGLPFRLPSGKTIRLDVNSMYIYNDMVAWSLPADVVFGEIEGVKEDDNPVILSMKL